MPGTRVEDADVQELFPGRTNIEFGPFIITAHVITDDVVAHGVTVGNTVSSAKAKAIELYLSAHFAELATTDGALAASSAGEATERYHNVYGQGLKVTRFGQQAILLDTTGYLAELSAKAEKTTLKSAEFRVI